MEVEWSKVAVSRLREIRRIYGFGGEMISGKNFGVSEGSGSSLGSRRRAVRSAAILLAAAALGSRAECARAVDTVINNTYHAQVTNYFCAAASMEMELDSPTVLATNTVVASLIGAGDGPLFAPNTPFVPTANIQIQNGVGTVTAGAQDFIYGLVHGINTVNGITYLNPALPAAVGNGCDNLGIAQGLNLLDNPNTNGAANPAFAFGNHQYVSYNIPQFPNPPIPNAALNIANKTIADALLQPWQVSAVAAINNGSHAINVNGVRTTGNSVPGGNYQIQGYFVHDPWTGYQLGNGPLNQGQLNGIGGVLGLGYNTFVSNQAAVGSTTAIGGQQVAVSTPSWWTRIFGVAGPQIFGGVNSAPGYKFEVEPQGPESLDTGQFDSTPAFPTELATELNDTSPGFNAGVTSDLTSDPTLSAEPGFENGSFDFSTQDETFIQPAGDINGEGDWLVPYDGSGGINDITGAIMIDADTGIIDEATWIDPSNPAELPYSLLDLDAMFNAEAAGNLPNDDTVPLPEPASLASLFVGASLLLRRRANRPRV
jgi:hypothetical protein